MPSVAAFVYSLCSIKYSRLYLLWCVAIKAWWRLVIVEPSASPLFTTDHIQPEFSSFSLFLDDNKLKRAVHTPHNARGTPYQYRTECKQGMNPGKIHAKPASHKSFANQWCQTSTWHGVWRHRETCTIMTNVWNKNGDKCNLFMITSVHEIKLVSTSASCFYSWHLTRKMKNDILPPLRDAIIYTRGHQHI